jgi:hypothetical protein
MPELSYPQPGTASGKGRNISLVIFLAVILVGAVYCAVHLMDDLQPVRESSVMPYLLLGIALLIALGFEFVNGFHDTANAVATVIYTHSLAPNLAVVWSGGWNFLGVLTSSGAVAFGILQLLPVELILQVGSSAGFRDGLRLADRRDHLESRHVVVRTAVVELAYADRLDHRRRPDEPTDARHRRHEWRGLESGARRRQVLAVLAAGRLSSRQVCCC